MAGKIFLIPTPLAADTANAILSPQVKDIIFKYKNLFCRKPSHLPKAYQRIKTGLKIDELQFFLLDKDTPAAEVEKYLQLLEGGLDAAIMSEAGCPGIADPGSVAVSLAHKKNIRGSAAARSFIHFYGIDGLGL